MGRWKAYYYHSVRATMRRMRGPVALVVQGGLEGPWSVDQAAACAQAHQPTAPMRWAGERSLRRAEISDS